MNESVFEMGRERVCFGLGSRWIGVCVQNDRTVTKKRGSEAYSVTPLGLLFKWTFKRWIKVALVFFSAENK